MHYEIKIVEGKMKEKLAYEKRTIGGIGFGNNSNCMDGDDLYDPQNNNTELHIFSERKNESKSTETTKQGLAGSGR